MSEEEYYRIIKVLGLFRTQFLKTFVTANGEPVSVPFARDMTPEQRKETIEQIRVKVEGLISQ